MAIILDCTWTCAFTFLTIFDKLLEERILEVIIGSYIIGHRTRFLKLLITHFHSKVKLIFFLWVDACYVTPPCHMYAKLNVSYHVCINYLWFGTLQEMCDFHSMMMWVRNGNFFLMMLVKINYPTRISVYTLFLQTQFNVQSQL